MTEKTERIELTDEFAREQCWDMVEGLRRQAGAVTRMLLALTQAPFGDDEAGQQFAEALSDVFGSFLTGVTLALAVGTGRTPKAIMREASADAPGQREWPEILAEADTAGAKHLRDYLTHALVVARVLDLVEADEPPPPVPGGVLH